MDKNRRHFLDLSMGLVITGGLPRVLASAEQKLGYGEFLHGVASGDPLNDRVIIWTRITPKQHPASLKLIYEVSLLDNFSKLVQNGIAFALKENDYTVKIDVRELEAGTQYYYRFRAANDFSVVGETKTLPKHTNKTTLAVFSCANYTSGFFNVYKDATRFKDKIDAVVHLGDYIYEYGMFDDDGKPAYGTKNAKKTGRVLPKSNDKNLQTLKDYRLRYSLYRSDTDLQKLHQKYPFICIWDDHEVIDNANKTGADQTKFSIDNYEDLKHAAIKAYYEWLPIRPPYDTDNKKIYRVFHFGELFSLYMLETRLLNRAPQLHYDDYFQNDGNFNQATFQHDLLSTKRRLLGNEQSTWLKTELKNSRAHWQFIAQQVKVSESPVPQEIIGMARSYFNSNDDLKKAELKKQIVDVFYETSRIKARMTLKDATLTQQEKDRLSQMLPYNLDAWDGYPHERKVLYKILKDIDKATIILSGDAHFSWANILLDSLNKTVGIELGVTSVTSPGIEEDYDIDDSELLRQFEESNNIFNKNSLYSNFSDRGYLIVEINPKEVKAHWRYVDNILSREYSVLNERSRLLRIAHKDGHYHYRNQ